METIATVSWTIAKFLQVVGYAEFYFRWLVNSVIENRDKESGINSLDFEPSNLETF